LFLGFSESCWYGFRQQRSRDWISARAIGGGQIRVFIAGDQKRMRKL